MKNKVPYNLFEKWYKYTRHELVSVPVKGQPQEQEVQETVPGEGPMPLSTQAVIHIFVDIHISNGIYIRQGNLSYEGLKRLFTVRTRIKDENMFISRMTLTNWLEKGASYINEMIKVIKDNCLEKDSFKTEEIIIRLRSKLNSMLSEGHPPRGNLMDKALRYMKTFWKQLFAYTKDGSYTIDNSLAERFIRPLAGERKNSLFFGSDKMAGVSAAYHTIISTCRMQGISVLEYLRSFFREIVKEQRL